MKEVGSVFEFILLLFSRNWGTNEEKKNKKRKKTCPSTIPTDRGTDEMHPHGLHLILRRIPPVLLFFSLASAGGSLGLVFSEIKIYRRGDYQREGVGGWYTCRKRSQ